MTATQHGQNAQCTPRLLGIVPNSCNCTITATVTGIDRQCAIESTHSSGSTVGMEPGVEFVLGKARRCIRIPELAEHPHGVVREARVIDPVPSVVHPIMVNTHYCYCYSSGLGF